MSSSTKVTPERSSGWRSLWRLGRQHRARIVLLSLSSFGAAMCEAGFLVLVTGSLLGLTSGADRVGPVAGLETAVPTALIVAAAGLVLRFGLSMITVRQSAALAATVRNQLRQRLAASYLGASWSVHQSEPSGRLQELLSGFVGRVLAAVTAATQGLTAMLSMLAFLLAGFFVQPWATLGVLGFLAALAAVLGPLRRAIHRAAKKSNTADLAFASTVAELGTLGREMQVFGVRQAFTARIATLIEGASESQRRVQVLFGSLAPTYTFFAYGSVLLAVVMLSVVNPQDITSVGAAALLMLRSLTYGQQLVTVQGAVLSSLPAIDEVDETMRRYDASPAAAGDVTLPDALPLILHDVDFSYNGSRAALRQVNLTVPPGEVLAIVGPSGAGKSTMAQLLLGLRAPARGRITLGETPLPRVDRRWWTQKVSFVPQDPALFTGTVAENIRFFREGISDAAIRSAAARAHVLADIENLPDGFETHLGERGANLSGGQRQRLSIARALAGQPSLLILDEPTSALDGQSETLIRQTLVELKGHTTIVIIAHRMSTIDMCDRVMVVEDGEVTTLATPAEAFAENGFYRAAVERARAAPGENPGFDREIL